MIIKLRGEYSTEDIRLDRIPYFDERSRNYAIRPVVESAGTKDPRSYTWRCDKHLDQGQEGACVGFGVTHELIARPAAVAALNNSYAREVYNTAKKIDPFPGENYEGTTVLAGVEVVRRIGWIDGYYWAFGMEDLILGIGYHGPAVLGLVWYQGMTSTDANGFIHPSGKVVGGHCILCKSVNVTKERFTFHNSWGTKWGMNGDCYISFKDMQFLLNEGGEAVFFTGRKKK